MNEGIEPGDVWSIGDVPPCPMPSYGGDELPPPTPPKLRRLRQPTKDRLREQLALAASEIERWKGEVDALAAQLEGEGKCFGAGVLAGWLSVLLVWWIK